ncbi:UDP-galactopyranose mutase [Thermodesulfovibrio yellowstonii]|uniref:UDP-galactopyranose mutase n=1 Tax=Thermodesulfovibrio yellowstonii TaxID=28262 RepID=A0A9W6GEA6_9BACT|nr:UDP-galactopyranose mutase [Thermodesulfovibrio islandicus]GLI52410.1 UDP-galactopyranose mutase [Thermodesulfovibrio islandicus]
MFNYIVIGSGFAGSVIAERIANVLNEKVLIIEKRNHIGGNCYDYKNKDGIIIHKYGPHLFHTDYKDVFDYLSNFTDWNIYHHKVLAFIDGKKVPIPFNLNSLYIVFPQTLARRIEEKLLKRYPYNSKVPILDLKEENDEDLKFLADYVYQKVFLNYTAKQWGLKPEEIDKEVTARVPVFIGKDDRYFTDRYQAIPIEGYSKIFERMLNHKNIKIMLNTDFKEVINIDFENKKIYFLEQEFKGKLIFTGMIDELFDFKYGYLPYRSLDLRFESLEKEWFQEVATVNYPNDYDFTRITEFKHIHPVNLEKTIILREYPKQYTPNKDIPYYPIFTKENQELYNRYREEIEKFENIILVGRLAEYRYYDMDDVVKRALEVFEEKIK